MAEQPSENLEPEEPAEPADWVDPVTCPACGGTETRRMFEVPSDIPTYECEQCHARFEVAE